MHKIEKTNVFYLFIEERNKNDTKRKNYYSKMKKTVYELISFSKDFPVGHIVQIMINISYGLREMIRDSRDFNYESYFTKGISNN